MNYGTETEAPSPQPLARCENTWASGVADVLEALSTDAANGLQSVDAIERQLLYGPNQLRAAKRRSVLSIITDQFKSIVILLLAAAGSLAILFANHIEGLAIFVVIAINAAIGFVTEWRAIRSMEALKVLGHVDTVVMRNGIVQQIPAAELVPGDIVVFESGDIVTADIRLVEAADLQADESTLTGESLPTGKQTEPLSLETPVMDRSNMVFKGTAITRGGGKGVVVGIGLETELGRISKLVTEAESQHTPLEKRLNKLGERLAIAVGIIALFIAIAGVLAGRDTILAIEVAIALAVAAIPEGLPIVATIALARGMWRMAKRNAIIAKLSAVETLGATSVILTDKTGTLTENQMSVTEVCLAGADVSLEAARTLDAETSSLLNELLVTATLCNNASLQESPAGDRHAIGDPTEIALLNAALQQNIRREELLLQTPEIAEVPFNPDSKLMATLHSRNPEVLFAVKGAPESVIRHCNAVRGVDGDSALSDEQKERWLERANEMGDRGLRTLAIACKVGSDASEEPFGNLVLLGIAGLEDPPRDGVQDAINRCRRAGISVVMVTGDHQATARNIAGSLGMLEGNVDSQQFINGSDINSLLRKSGKDALLAARVFSRATPEQKLRLLSAYQQHGHIVAMTGDGVNDAPALKKADIGIAMGIRGTAVAREAAHMVLQDDEFGTIVEAVAQGRAIYENIRKFVVYLLSCNISEVLIVTLATIAGAPLPLLPLQILFLNLVTDVFPALALGVGKGTPSLMKQRPRSADEPVLTTSHWIRIGLHGVIISVAVLGAMAVAVFLLEFEPERAVTISFCTLALAQLWHVFNMRDNIHEVFRNEVTMNKWIWVAIAICLALLATAIYSPVLSEVLSLTNPGSKGWFVILPMSLLPFIVAPLVRQAAQRLRKQP